MEWFNAKHYLERTEIRYKITSFRDDYNTEAS